MSTISNNDIANAIYLVSKNKTETELRIVNNKIIKFLTHKRFLSKTNDILERLDKIINRENKKIIVKISSAKKLKEEIKIQLALFLKKRYEMEKIVFNEIIDEKLLGGIRIEIDDEIIDLTIKNKIRKLQEHLTRKI
ncbi:MAG: ATP synthase subunit delta [Candidatus Nomurabacteria bacterium GW2011_GWE1_32_28]|uniref:ATP synthase subunit delta n=1 Tax=Candidatus Nomurabacteria bacterium GW2011_GWF1_31_48 TaxID=1618767 RepID=A0A0F9YGJ9_9BACT|nr:MAG: ATP synthase subunit delta [Candidatus Nomurabacteria bacterium GW2011_GWF2_30_133]KKP29037.1 MAG: ATP synthase subunit delta [Candidatus Nomurabacteria bacterium GW2011_GWE2_31_40]KKP30553.1 MAG: ATP synthase subunit delta [Candidatus Nomurabacteria bacterium GW2011_GWF1_31_48]KKP35038.1 MAG: ATP synthase subunit delta [Candidatus Nomurabacteria bacterium GW2011_GWE1_32_28]HAS80597.1 hypothetical protein [Candidatus Nomurabacteria bacterium]